MSDPLVPTRGERNNNPGNLRFDNTQWTGLAMPPQDDGGYCVFQEMRWGLRALARDLYVKNHYDGLLTVRAIIARYAPPAENNTEAYEQDVADRLGVMPDQAIDLTKPDYLKVFVHAVVLHENGRCLLPDSVFDQAVRDALPQTPRR